MCCPIATYLNSYGPPSSWHALQRKEQGALLIQHVSTPFPIALRSVLLINASYSPKITFGSFKLLGEGNPHGQLS